MSVTYPEVSDGTEYLPYPPLEDYPLTPLLGESSTQVMDQSWVAQPEPQSQLRVHPLQWGNSSLPVAQLWPLHVAELNPLFPAHQILTDPCPQQLEEHSPVDYSASSQVASIVEPYNGPRPELPAEVNDGLPVFTKPFSELLEGDAIAEATKFGNRSIEQRRWEAQIAGRVKRPCNSFILYRNSYLPALHGHDNSKASRLLAKSWAMERDSVRQSFKEIADTDKSLHAQAFPDYKFQARMSLKNKKKQFRNKRRDC